MADRAARGAPELADALKRYPVIAAVRDERGLQAALEAPVRVIFLLSASLSQVGRVGTAVRQAGKLLFVHMDFVTGLGRDEAALEFLVESCAPTGVISTKTNLVHAARRLGITPVQRLFLLDSQSLQTGIDAARSSKAEVVEVLPGIIPRALAHIRTQIPHTLLITGGLLRSPREIGRALAAGAAGVSTGSPALWRKSLEELTNGG